MPRRKPRSPPSICKTRRTKSQKNQKRETKHDHRHQSPRAAQGRRTDRPCQRHRRRVTLAADEPLGIALVVPSPIGDVGWGHALAAGLEPIKAAYGDKVKVTILENIRRVRCRPDHEQGGGRRQQGADRRLVRLPEWRPADRPTQQRRHGAARLRFPGRPELLALRRQIFSGHLSDGHGAAALTKSNKLGSVSAFAIPSSSPPSTPSRSVPRRSSPRSRSPWSGSILGLTRPRSRKPPRR